MAEGRDASDPLLGMKHSLAPQRLTSAVWHELLWARVQILSNQVANLWETFPAHPAALIFPLPIASSGILLSLNGESNNCPTVALVFISL